MPYDRTYLGRRAAPLREVRCPSCRRPRILPPMTTTMEIEDTARIARLTRFATDALDLADRRADLDLRALLDDLYRDLIEPEEDR